MKPLSLPLLPLCLLLSGCQTPQIRSVVTPNDTPATAGSPTAVRDIYAGQPEVVRYDRYTLVSTAPDSAQRDLLNQMTDIRMPPGTVTTVGDALHYTLLETGFSLCPATGPQTLLYDRALPAVQRHLGPVRLSEALQLLAGPAWQLRVDLVLRQICFTLRPGFTAPAVTPATANVTAVTGAASTPLTAPALFSRGPAAAAPATSTRPRGNIDVVYLKTGTLMPDWSPSGSGKATLPVLMRRVMPAGWRATLNPGVETAANGQLRIHAWQGDRDWRDILDDLARENGWRISLNPDTRLAVVTPASTRVATTPSAATSGTATPPVTAPSATAAPAPTSPTVSAPPATATPTPASPPVSAPPATAALTPALPPVITRPLNTPIWTAEPGSTLRTFLTRSAATVSCPPGGKWTVVWPVNVDYPVAARLDFHGTFEEMLGKVFALYAPGRVDTPLYARASRSQCVVAVSDKPGD